MANVENQGNLGYNEHMNKQDRIAAIWGMNGGYYDAIMQACPAWVWTDQDFENWFYSQIGM